MKCKLCIRHQKWSKKVKIDKTAWGEIPYSWLTEDLVTRHSKSTVHIEAAVRQAELDLPSQLQRRLEALMYWLLSYYEVHDPS
jgi:hypothetical protein